MFQSSNSKDSRLSVVVGFSASDRNHSINQRPKRFIVKLWNIYLYYRKETFFFIFFKIKDKKKSCNKSDMLGFYGEFKMFKFFLYSVFKSFLDGELVQNITNSQTFWSELFQRHTFMFQIRHLSPWAPQQWCLQFVGVVKDCLNEQWRPLLQNVTNSFLRNKVNKFTLSELI